MQRWPGEDMHIREPQPVTCSMCRIGKYPHFGYVGSGACDHCGVVWTYDEGDTLTEESLRRLWEKVPRWIPVSERLPGEGERVLFFVSRENDAYAGVWAGEYLQAFNLWAYDLKQEKGWGSAFVTHWMPLPEPPAK